MKFGKTVLTNAKESVVLLITAFVHLRKFQRNTEGKQCFSVYCDDEDSFDSIYLPPEYLGQASNKSPRPPGTPTPTGYFGEKQPQVEMQEGV